MLLEIIGSSLSLAAEQFIVQYSLGKLVF